MQQEFVMLTLLTATIQTVTSIHWKSPWFGHKWDCPSFTNHENQTINGRTVEIRVYEPALWSATAIANNELRIFLVDSSRKKSVNTYSWDDAEQLGFQRNMNYFSGDNWAQKRIRRTTPYAIYSV